MLDKLIKDMVEKGLMSVTPLKLKGKANAVFNWLDLMANTREQEQLET